MGRKSGKVRVKQVGPKAPVNPLADLAIPPEEMIHLPPKPDSNISHVWPMSETFTMDYKRFHAIYPTYMDSTKTVKLGRRISAADAIPDPSAFEIGEALQSMSVRHVVQPYKGYSRDAESRWDNPGRVLVDLEDAAERGVLGAGVDGAFDVDDMPDVTDGSGGGMNKKVLMREVARRIPSLPSRIQRMEEKKRAEEEEQRARERAAAAAKSGAGGASSRGGAGHKKKKGKKKR